MIKLVLLDSKVDINNHHFHTILIKVNKNNVYKFNLIGMVGQQNTNKFQKYRIEIKYYSHLLANQK